MAVTSYYQQRQIQGRNPNADVPPQQQMLMRLMPADDGRLLASSPSSALVVYFVVSNLYRIGMQYYITRTLYHGEDSLGRPGPAGQCSRPSKLKDEHGSPSSLPRLQEVGGRRTRRPRTPRRRPPRTARRSQAERLRSQRRDERLEHQWCGATGTHLSDDGRRQSLQEEEEAQVAAVEWVETTGKTVEEAKDAALDQLGVDEQDAEFEVVEEPRAGLFGRTRGEARVRARVRPTQPRPKVERRDRAGPLRRAIRQAGERRRPRRARGGGRSSRVPPRRSPPAGRRPR